MPIGSLPREWDQVRLGDIFDIQQGIAMSVERRSKSPKYHFLRTINVLWGKVDLTTLDQMYFSDEETEKLRLKKDDLLLCEGGEIGRTAIWTGELDSCYHQNHVYRLRKKTDEICPEFYMYWIQVAFLQLGLYSGEAIRTTIPNLSRGRLQTFILPKPSLPEQQKIAFVLSKIHQVIEQQERIIETTRNLKKSLMQKLFTEGIGHTEFKETELGQMPEEWDVVALAEILIQAQYGLSKKGEKQGAFPILRMNNLEDGSIKTDNLQYVNLDEKILRHFKLAKDDLLFNRTNSIDLVGRTSIFDLDGDFVFASYLIRLKIEPDEAVSKFINYFLNWNASQARLKGLATRAVGQSNISATRLKTFTIPIPSIPEQNQISNIIEIVTKKINVEEKRKFTLQCLFKTMLKKLMTGAIRVKDLDLEGLHAD